MNSRYESSPSRERARRLQHDRHAPVGGEQQRTDQPHVVEQRQPQSTYVLGGGPERAPDVVDVVEQVRVRQPRHANGAARLRILHVVRGLELRFDGSRRYLDVDTEDGRSGRLFTATVARLRTQYTFNARAFVRAIGQYVSTKRDPSLYTFEVDSKEGDFSGSILLAYKLNWQSVLYVGYGDTRTLDESGALARADRQFFLKVSYAFQR